MNEDQLIDLLKKTISVIEQADVPTDLRPDAFRAVWLSLVGTPSSTPAATLDGDDSPIIASPVGNVWSQLSERLAIEADALEDVYELREDGSFAVRVPTSTLPRAKSAATRDLALLVCVGRQITVEEWTPAEAIRSVCQDYGKFDSANHAANMAEGDAYWQISGSGKDRRYKLRKAGWEQAGQLVRRLAGG